MRSAFRVQRPLQRDPPRGADLCQTPCTPLQSSQTTHDTCDRACLPCMLAPTCFLMSAACREMVESHKLLRPETVQYCTRRNPHASTPTHRTLATAATRSTDTQPLHTQLSKDRRLARNPEARAEDHPGVCASHRLDGSWLAWSSPYPWQHTPGLSSRGQTSTSSLKRCGPLHVWASGLERHLAARCGRGARRDAAGPPVTQ